MLNSKDRFLAGFQPEGTLKGPQGDLDLVVHGWPGGDALEPKTRSNDNS
jgi:hypothetical protein